MSILLVSEYFQRFLSSFRVQNTKRDVFFGTPCIYIFKAVYNHIRDGNSASIYLPFPAKRTGRSEGRGKVIIAEVTLRVAAPFEEEDGEAEAEEEEAEEEDGKGEDEAEETVEEEEAEEKDGEGEDKAEEAVKEEEEDEGPAIKKFKTT